MLPHVSYRKIIIVCGDTSHAWDEELLQDGLCGCADALILMSSCTKNGLILKTRACWSPCIYEAFTTSHE